MVAQIYLTSRRFNVFAAICPTRYSLPAIGAWEKARLLRDVLREVDRTMENSSEGFLATNRNFFQAPRDTESI